jgi:hypothetical protein
VRAEITLAGAIAGLVAEKRALGYKYVCEERALARFSAFCASEFPGLDTVTRASVEAWIACARRRAVKPATVNNLIAPVRELARWLGRRGVDAYVLPARCPSPPGTSRTSTATRNSRRCSRRPTGAATARRCRSGIW